MSSRIEDLGIAIDLLESQLESAVLERDLLNSNLVLAEEKVNYLRTSIMNVRKMAIEEERKEAADAN